MRVTTAGQSILFPKARNGHRPLIFSHCHAVHALDIFQTSLPRPWFKWGGISTSTVDVNIRETLYTHSDAPSGHDLNQFKVPPIAHGPFPDEPCRQCAFVVIPKRRNRSGYCPISLFYSSTYWAGQNNPIASNRIHSRFFILCLNASSPKTPKSTRHQAEKLQDRVFCIPNFFEPFSFSPRCFLPEQLKDVYEAIVVPFPPLFSIC